MKTQTGILSALLVGALGYAGYLHFENANLRDQLENQEAVALVEAVEGETLKPVAAVEEQKNEAPVTEQVVVKEATPSAHPPRPDFRARGRERMARMTAAFNDPEMRADMIERQMNRIDSQYAGFFKTLDLSPDEMDTLRTLMAERSIVGREARMRGFPGATDEDREKASEARDMQRGILKEQVEELLGEETTAALKDYSESLPYRQEVEALASSLSFTETPLNAEQNELLVQSLQTVSTEFEYTKDFSNMRRFGGQDLSATDVAVYFEERTTYDELVISAAEQALSEEQMAVFAERQIADRERDQRRMEFMLQSREEN